MTLPADEARAEAGAFDRLKAELTRAFAVPDTAYRPLNADSIIPRNRLTPFLVQDGADEAPQREP